MNVDARTSVRASATIPDVRLGQYSMSVRLDDNLLPHFQTRKKPAFSLHVSRSKRRPFNRSLQVWVSAMICNRRTEEREEISG